MQRKAQVQQRLKNAQHSGRHTGTSTGVKGKTHHANTQQGVEIVSGFSPAFEFSTNI